MSNKGVFSFKQFPIKDQDKEKLVRIRVGIFFDESDRLASDMFVGKISIGQWQEQMKALIREVHSSCAAIGAGGWDEMTSSQWGRLGTPLREQYRYLQGFAEFIDENRDSISLRAIQARARLYGDGAGGSTILIQAGPFFEDSLPWLPKDGSTPCLNRCHCRWVLNSLGEKPDGSVEVVATWVLGVAEHCEVCDGRNGHTVAINVPSGVEIPDFIGGIK